VLCASIFQKEKKPFNTLFSSHKAHCIPVVLDGLIREMCEVILTVSNVQSKQITEGFVQKFKFILK